MYYSKWETLDNIKENMSSVSLDGRDKNKSFGLPIAYNDDKVYYDAKRGHSVILAGTGSGKTQTITLPMLKFSSIFGESVIVTDTQGEIYDVTNELFKNNGYNIIRLDFNSCVNTNSWNPFELAEKYFKEGKKDLAYDEIECIANMLFNEDNSSADPFWINSARSFFIGICSYLLEKKEKLTLDKIYETINSMIKDSEKCLEGVSKYSRCYIELSVTINAPKETKASILAVFLAKYRVYITRENMKKMLEKSDFDLNNIFKEKTIVYISFGKSSISANLVPLFIEQVCSQEKVNDLKLNILIDDFYYLNPIKDFDKLLSNSREKGINFTIFLRGYNDLKNAYGNNQAEIVKLCFSNTVYLLSQDIETLKEISDMCGNQSTNKPLISVEELKTLDTFEAIVLVPRTMPIRTKYIPYFKLN